MMNSLQAGFATILQKELGQLAQLEVVLSQEHAALKQRDSDALVTNTDEKQRVIESIESCGRERSRLLQDAGIATDKDTVLAFVKMSPELLSKWNELEVVLLRCQEQNKINGLLIDRGRQQTTQILKILLGDGGNENTELYDAKGSTSSSFSKSQSIKV